MNLSCITKLSILILILLIGGPQTTLAEPFQEVDRQQAPTMGIDGAAPNKASLLRWASPPTFIWYYSTSSQPYWLKSEEGLKLFENAAAAWQKCGVHIVYGGQTNQIPKPNKELNIAGWGELPSHIRGFTFRAQRSGILNQADIMINSENADIKNDFRLLQKVVTHEFGHALGLYHSKGCYDVMTSAAVCGKTDLPPPLQPTINDLEQCKMRYESK